jgi:hypothetical protein
MRFQLYGGPLPWRACTQQLTSHSSTESELYALDEATRENQYLLKLLADFGIDVALPVTIGQDNQSTIQLATSGHYDPRTKHVALRYMYVHELQQQGIVTLKWVPTDSMPADVLTKALSKVDHNRLCSVLIGRSVLQWPPTARSGSKAGGMMSSRKRGRSTDMRALRDTHQGAR